jgi:hypothetical protein
LTGRFPFIAGLIHHEQLSGRTIFFSAFIPASDLRSEGVKYWGKGVHSLKQNMVIFCFIVPPLLAS